MHFLMYHAGRLLGAPDKGKTALLGDENHPVAKSWCVQKVCTTRNKRVLFDLPKLDGYVVVKVLPLQRRTPSTWERDSRRSDNKRSLPAMNGPWFLLAKGHSRVVNSVIRRRIEPRTGSLKCKPVILVLKLGDERQALPSGKSVFSAEAAASSDPVPMETAKAIYSELGSQIRALTDVRFKLLTIVPTITGLAVTVLMTQTIRDSSPLLVLMASLFGFGVTLGIRIYDLRNSQLYDDLIRRARSLESFLGVERGPYMRRSKNIWPLQHDVALFLIYLLVLAAWLVGAGVSLTCAAGGLPC